jgi:NADH-quinone oxidoreductase B subunit
LKLLQKAINWATRKSPWIIHYNAGSCNGCDIETIDALTPRFDLERMGIVQQGSPRHADILVCTGAVTIQTRERLKQIYDQMPEPKYVIAVGTCACSGGIFDGCYCVMGGVDSVIPVDVYVPGCAVRPEAIISAVQKLLDTLDQSKKNLTGNVKNNDENNEETGGDKCAS